MTTEARRESCRQAQQLAVAAKRERALERSRLILAAIDAGMSDRDLAQLMGIRLRTLHTAKWKAKLRVAEAEKSQEARN